MKRRLTLISMIAAVSIAGVLFRLPVLKAVTAAYSQTVRIVNSTGTVIGGTASGVTAAYNQTVQVVDSTGHVIDSFGGGGSGTVTSVSGTANQVAVATGTTTPIISLIGPYTPATFTAHGIMLGEGTASIAQIAVCANGSFPYGQTALDPICSTLILPNAATAGDLLTATSTNTIGSVADVAVGQVLISGGVGVVPAYSATLPAVSGANVTALNAGNVSTGALLPSRGGFGVGVFSGASYNLGCSASSSTIGPGSGAQMAIQVVYQPVPFSFVNGDVTYVGGTLDATVESDVCHYQLTSATAASLIADTGLVAIVTGGNPTILALGGGTSNLATQPTASTCGSGSGITCTAGQFPAGFYAVAFASASTTPKIKICNTTAALSYYHATTTSAPSGECPATITGITLSPNFGSSPMMISVW
jgi:hypothetical protein